MEASKKNISTLAIVAAVGGGFYLLSKGSKLLKGAKLNFALLGFQLHKLNLKELQFTVKLRSYNPTKEDVTLAVNQVVAHYKGKDIAYSKPDIKGVTLKAGTTQDLGIRFQVPYMNLLGKGLSLPLLQDSSTFTRDLSFTLTLTVNGETITTTEKLTNDMQGLGQNHNVFDAKGSNSRLAQPEICEFTPVNDHFSGKRNAEVGRLGQTLGIVSGARNTQNGSKYNHLIKKAAGEDRHLKEGDVSETVEACIDIVADHYREVEELAKHLQGGSVKATCRNIFNFSYNYLQYKLDERGTEQLRTPARSWLDGQIKFAQRGDKNSGIDCDDYSIFVGSLLKNLGIPFKFRITKYDGKHYFQHIYIVVPFDGDSEDEIVIDPVLSKFDYQKPYSFEKSNFNLSPLQLAGGIHGISGLSGTTGLGLPISVLSGFDLGGTQATKNDYEDLMGIVSGVDFEDSLNGLGSMEDATYRYLVRTRDFLKRSKSNAQKMAHIQNPDQFIKMLDEAIKYWHSDKRESVLNKLADIEEALAQNGFIKYDSEALQGLDELEDLEDELDGLLGLSDEELANLTEEELGFFRRRRRRKRKGKKRRRGGFFRSIRRIGKKIGRGIKKGVKKVGKVAKKIGKAILRYNPLTIAIRGGLLAAMRINLFGLAKKLQYGYLPDNLASKHNIDARKLASLKQRHNRVKKLFRGLQGKEKNLKKNILKGAKQRSKDFSLKGLEGIQGDLQALEAIGGLGELGELGAAATTASIGAAAGVLAKIKRWLKPVGSIFNKVRNKVRNITKKRAQRRVARRSSRGKRVSPKLRARAKRVIKPRPKPQPRRTAPVRTQPIQRRSTQPVSRSTPEVYDPNNVQTPPIVSTERGGRLLDKLPELLDTYMPQEVNTEDETVNTYGGSTYAPAHNQSYYSATPHLKKGMSKGAKIGIGVGVAALIGVGIYFATRKKSEDSERSSKRASPRNKKQLGAIKLQ